MKGSYLILINLKDKENIQIGKLGKIDFKKGIYVYVGSAFNGLEQRINRHLNEDKKLHWHIDYLLRIGEISDIFYKKTTYNKECNIAKFLDRDLSKIKGFGCSDCNCNSHLFYGNKDNILKIIKKLEMKKYYNAKT